MYVHVVTLMICTYLYLCRYIIKMIIEELKCSKGNKPLQLWLLHDTSQMKINRKQSCLAMGLTTSVTIKSPNNPQPLNDYYIITWYYMLQCGNFILNLSSQIEMAKQEIARHGCTFHSSQWYSRPHIKFNESRVRSFCIASHVSGISSCCGAGPFWKSRRWRLQSCRAGDQPAAPTVSLRCAVAICKGGGVGSRTHSSTFFSKLIFF